MKTQAAVLFPGKGEWVVEEIDLDPPKAQEILVRIRASGMYHSEEHHLTGDVPLKAPTIGGHEGAGVVEEVGPGVTTVRPGDHVVFSSIPTCERCPSCATGHGNLCDLAMWIGEGRQLRDHTARHHLGGTDLNLICLLGAFAHHTVVNEASIIKIADELPFDKACIVGCGVPTGWGAAVYSGGVRAGDDVCVVGVGGIGASAIQGARFAGARRIFAVDPVPWKREQALALGATHVAASIEEAFELVREVTRGRFCNVTICSMGVGRGELMGSIMQLAAKQGRVVVVNIHPVRDVAPTIDMLNLTGYEKQVVGSIFGSVNSRRDVPMLLDLYQEEKLDLDRIVSRTYGSLEQVNEGYQDMRDGKNLRGVLVF
ncbi:MAG TPA: NDMA-dependent alcohol dehydrogenase [Acidimicrobiales bacterium]|nr:NDMA-dependent alcohol dehydrogenase [Acidimicrobiales bacterium]